MRLAERILPLETNVFADMGRAKVQAEAQGLDVIDLSLGSSDLPTPPHVLEAIARALHDSSTHGYLLHQGTQAFRRAAAAWYTRKFGVAVDPETEVLPLIGSQEGTAHLPLVVLNPGDIALLPDPAYPSHAGGIHLASGQVYSMPLQAEHQFLPVFEAVPEAIWRRARLMVLSYPHNPTTAIAPQGWFEQALAWCDRYDLVLAHDFPYPDYWFGGAIAPSVLQADPEKRRSIEFFTLSKSYNMGGFRVGYAIGNPQLITALRQIKSVIDFNQYRGILAGAIAALTGPQDCVSQARQQFRERRDRFVQILNAQGWVVPTPEATLYVWAKLPPPWSQDSLGFCQTLVTQTGVVASPGIGFGPAGEGYVRFALVHGGERLGDAAQRIGQLLRSSGGGGEAV